MSAVKAVHTITVDLGDEGESLDRRLASGEYRSADEVLRAALRALDREASEEDEVLRSLIDEAMDDLQPDVPAEEVFARLEKKYPLAAQD